jgi:adenylate kinase
MLTEQGIGLDAVVRYELPLEAILNRLGGRRSCPQCKAVFHLETQPPKVNGVCDHCGSGLYQREDDRPESIRVRMEVYERSTTPLIEFYREQGLLVSVLAHGKPAEILEATLAALRREEGAGASQKRRAERKRGRFERNPIGG